jgi:ABC-type bacteriocin/lantibiotic exporter with double-glycine peptidase domain
MKENADYDFYFIVTHRNDILKYADKIIHISHGKIIQTKENPPIEKTFSVH